MELFYDASPNHQRLAMSLRTLILSLSALMLLSAPALASPVASCPAMRDDQVAVRIDVRRAPPTYYDGESWRVQSEADTKVRASSVAGMGCYYITAATVTITMAGITSSSYVPTQTLPNIERIRAYVTNLIHSRNGAALSGSESDHWQMTALNDINRVAHAAITELKN
jgi:hypothetical protein